MSGQRHDAAGRSRREKVRIEGAFVPLRMAMLASSAWRALPDNARRVLDALHVEHLRHAGNENGRLPCSYGDFELAGVRRRSIPLALRQAAALGFLEVVETGFVGASGFKKTSAYRLTYIDSVPAENRFSGKPTDEWAKVTDIPAALAKADEEQADAERKWAAKTAKARGRWRPYVRSETAPHVLGAKPPLMS